MSEEKMRPTSIRVDEMLYLEFAKYAKSEGRSVSKQLAREMQKAVDEWRQKSIADFPHTAASAGKKRQRVGMKGIGK